MTDKPLTSGARLELKHTTRWVHAQIVDVTHRIDVRTLERDRGRERTRPQRSRSNRIAPGVTVVLRRLPRQPLDRQFHPCRCRFRGDRRRRNAHRSDRVVGSFPNPGVLSSPPIGRSYLQRSAIKIDICGCTCGQTDEKLADSHSAATPELSTEHNVSSAGDGGHAGHGVGDDDLRWAPMGFVRNRGWISAVMSQWDAAWREIRRKSGHH